MYGKSTPSGVEIFDLGVQGRSNTVDVEVGGGIYKFARRLKVANDALDVPFYFASKGCGRLDLYSYRSASKFAHLSFRSDNEANN